MPPELYGWQHLTYLAIYAIVLVATIVLTHYFIKTEKAKTILIKSVAGLLLVLILINRISVAVRYQSALSFIPNTYCGVTSLVLSIAVLVCKPNSKAYDFLWYMGFVGGIATLFYPDFLSQDVSFFYLPTISGLLHHSVLLILCILMLQTKWFTPQLKNWKYFPIGMACYTLYGLFIIDVCGWENAMSINDGIIEGTPLNWWFITIVGTVLVVAFLLIVEYFRKQKAKKSAPKTADQNEVNPKS